MLAYSSVIIWPGTGQEPRQRFSAAGSAAPACLLRLPAHKRAQRRRLVLFVFHFQPDSRFPHTYYTREKAGTSRPSLDTQQVIHERMSRSRSLWALLWIEKSSEGAGLLLVGRARVQKHRTPVRTDETVNSGLRNEDGRLRLRVLAGNLRPHDYYSAAAATALLASSICFNSSAFRFVGAMSISILLRVPVNLNGDW